MIKRKPRDHILQRDSVRPFEVALHHVSHEHGRRDFINSNTKLPHFPRRRLSQVCGRTFAHAIEVINVGWDEPCCRGVVDNRATTAGTHVSDLVFETEEHTLGVRTDDPIEIRFCSIRDTYIEFQSRIVERTIYAPVRLDRGIHQRGHLRLVAHVCINEYPISTRIFDELNGLLPSLLLDICDYHPCARTRECYCGGATDAAGAARNDDHFVLKRKHTRAPLSRIDWRIAACALKRLA